MDKWLVKTGNIHICALESTKVSCNFCIKFPHKASYIALEKIFRRQLTRAEPFMDLRPNFICQEMHTMHTCSILISRLFNLFVHGM